MKFIKKLFKPKLGLPLEYQKMSQYFDLHNISDDTDKKNAVVEKLLKKYNAKTVLDLTCGTGSQVFFLARRGYKIIGSDFSAPLIKIAREKALREKIDVKFLDGDMRKIQVGQFDAAITMFNAIGHLTKSDFEKALKNISKNLNNGGIYIFDIFNLNAMNDEVVENLKMQINRKQSDVEIQSNQHSKLDRKKGLLTSYDEYLIKESGKTKKIKNKFSLQIYTANELKNILERNGFKVLNQYGIDGSQFEDDKSLNILTVSQRIK